jgi:hypothetical protein
MKPSDVVEPHLRLREAAERLGISTAQAWQLFRGRPGVVILKLSRGRHGRRVVLIPESVFLEPTWTAEHLAQAFSMRLAAIYAVFAGERGVVRTGEHGEQLLVPESVRKRVFRKMTPIKLEG